MYVAWAWNVNRSFVWAVATMKVEKEITVNTKQNSVFLSSGNMWERDLNLRQK
jgi:hypothetical protein